MNTVQSEMQETGEGMFHPPPRQPHPMGAILHRYGARGSGSLFAVSPETPERSSLHPWHGIRCYRPSLPAPYGGGGRRRGTRREVGVIPEAKTLSRRHVATGAVEAARCKPFSQRFRRATPAPPAPPTTTPNTHQCKRLLMRVVVGGTFDPLHAGHRKLLSRSFDLAGPAGEVVIGLTTDEFAGTKEHPVQPYQKRLDNVTAFILEKGYTASWAVEPLSDRYGSAVDADFDILVVSEETFHVALDINELRRQNGLAKVDLYVVSCVLAEDERRISSTRIYRGEIDPHGRLIR